MARTSLGVKLASHYVSIADLLALADHVEASGFDSVWVTEGRMAPDAITSAAAIAARTERIGIGTSVLNPFTRSPGLIAVSAAAIDQLSQGRFVLGIGPGDPAVLGRQGIPYIKPLTRLRECVHIVRELLAAKKVSYHGTTMVADDLELDFCPHAPRIPIHLGATGPRALAQAGEIGDGILLNVCVPRTAVEHVLANARTGVRVIGNIVVGMHQDGEIALRGTKPLVVNYLTRFPSTRRASGLPESLVDKMVAARAVSMADACAVLPDECVRQLVAVGTPDECRRWIRDYIGGLDEALLMPAFGEPRMIIEELATLL